MGGARVASPKTTSLRGAAISRRSNRARDRRAPRMFCRNRQVPTPQGPREVGTAIERRGRRYQMSTEQERFERAVSEAYERQFEGKPTTSKDPRGRVISLGRRRRAIR